MNELVGGRRADLRRARRETDGFVPGGPDSIRSGTFDRIDARVGGFQAFPEALADD